MHARVRMRARVHTLLGYAACHLGCMDISFRLLGVHLPVHHHILRIIDSCRGMNPPPLLSPFPAVYAGPWGPHAGAQARGLPCHGEGF